MTIETKANLKAVHEVLPEASTVAEGLKHLLNDMGREAITVYRIIKSYGAKLEKEQIAKFKECSYEPIENPRQRDFFSNASDAHLVRSHGPLLYNSWSP